MLGCAGEFLTQLFPLRGNTHGATVHVANAGHDAALRDHRNTPETEFFTAHHRSDNNVPAGLDASVDAQGHTLPQAIADKNLLCLSQSLLPGSTCMHDAAQGRSTGASIMARNLDDICVGLGHTRGNRSDARACNELDGHLGLWADLMQVIDELGQVLDGIDIVVRGRGDQFHTWDAVTQGCNVLVHLGSGQLTTLTRLRTLGDLDLQLLCAREVLRGHAEAPRGKLLRCRGRAVAILESLQVWETG
mmetsp:Transcript_90956/g.235813  ORF Transcript_90956/g.235813 Transcript_90956/m.235813 type:complete len:247 (-) Transcript_90956:2908-3648(-)